MRTSDQSEYQIDTFTDTPLKGNPAGVMIVDEAMTDERMQNIAADLSGK
ncbi:MAG: PhzF family phenazine biosynthesis protein [Bacteroidales bacterium]|nr:PhzF family phenazine biosynthesis protein [Bacteroidales bacterium]MCF8334251.1 PhzF family phenazine biosynthesis protein [Bacteroidales bacterium]